MILRIAFVALYLLGIRTTLFVTRNGSPAHRWRLRLASVFWPLLYVLMAGLVVLESFGDWSASEEEDEDEDEPAAPGITLPGVICPACRCFHGLGVGHGEIGLEPGSHLVGKRPRTHCRSCGAELQRV